MAGIRRRLSRKLLIAFLDDGSGVETNQHPQPSRATPAMPDDTTAPFLFPAVGRKKLTAAFDGGRMTSDGGVMLLAAAERRLGVAGRLARLIADPRNPAFVTHSIADILRARMLAIACGHEDGDDLDHLRTDPGFKLACGRLPDSGRDLCSQRIHPARAACLDDVRFASLGR